MGSSSSLLSMQTLHPTPSAESSRASVDARKFDFSAAMMDPNQSPVPVCVSGSLISDMSQSACDRVKFTTGHSMDFLMPDITSGGTVEKNPVAPEVDLTFGRNGVPLPKTEDWLSNGGDRKVENMETMSKMLKDEVVASEPDTDTKISSSMAPVSVSQASAEVEVLTQLKTDLDKPPCASGDVVATSNVTSSSSCSAAAAAAVSGTATTGASEMTPLASASDLKKEAQAISYDWVSCQLIDHILLLLLLLRVFIKRKIT